MTNESREKFFPGEKFFLYCDLLFCSGVLKQKQSDMKTSFIVRSLVMVFLLVSSAMFLNGYNHLFGVTREALGKYFDAKWLIWGHIIPGGMALLIGPTQLLRELRNKSLKLHRWLGKVYVICVALSATGALCLTFVTTSQEGPMYTIGLWFLVLVWICTTGIAYWTIRQRRVAEHEHWMVRSYIVTFAFIVQNYILKIPGVMNLGTFPEVAPTLFWLSWAVPLFVYEIYLTTFVRVKRV